MKEVAFSIIAVDEAITFHREKAAVLAPACVNSSRRHIAVWLDVAVQVHNITRTRLNITKGISSKPTVERINVSFHCISVTSLFVQYRLGREGYCIPTCLRSGLHVRQPPHRAPKQTSPPTSEKSSRQSRCRLKVSALTRGCAGCVAPGRWR